MTRAQTHYRIQMRAEVAVTPPSSTNGDAGGEKVTNTCHTHANAARTVPIAPNTDAATHDVQNIRREDNENAITSVSGYRYQW